MIHTLRVPVKTNDESLEKISRDDLFDGDNDGVLFCADLGFGWSYPGGDLPRQAPADPLEGAIIRDLKEKHDGKVGKSENITYQGGGFDFAGVTDGEFGIEIPAEVSAAIYGNQNYLFCVYMKMPALSQWNTLDSIAGMITGTTVGATYQNAVDIFTIAQSKVTNGLGVLSLRLQNGNGTALTVQAGLPTGFGFYADKVVQIAFYVKDGRAYLRAKTGNTEVSRDDMYAGNPQNFSDNTIKVGGSPSGFKCTGNKSSFRVYRTFIEDLSLSGRDPLVVLDADLVRVNNRNVFS